MTRQKNQLGKGEGKAPDRQTKAKYYLTIPEKY